MKAAQITKYSKKIAAKVNDIPILKLVIMKLFG